MLRRVRLLLAVSALTLVGAAPSLRAADAPTTTTTVSTTSTLASTTTTTTTPSTTTRPATTTTASTTTARSTTTTARSTTTTARSTTTTTTTTSTTSTTTTTPVPPPALTTSTAPSTVVFTGHGWGHGVGMSQWGAYGYALHGWTYDAILEHYYSGTTVGNAPGATVRVLLADGAKRVALASDADFRIVDGAGTSVLVPAGKLMLTKALEVNGQPLVSPLLVKPGTAPLQLAGKPYRGRFRVILVGDKLQVVNLIGIEQYLLGVVPSESPSSWPVQALQAQAVAARSYALAELTTVVTASNYDLYSDTRSQVYEGIAAETPQGDRAVEDTIHQVVLYDGAIATTYFSSSSGGRTLSAADAFGKAVPYLLSVPDPYDTYSPNHDWGPVLFDARAVAKVLGLKGQQLVDLQTVNGPSGRVSKVTAIGSVSQLSLTGGALRSDLGLRSNWFSVGWLALDPPAAVAYGTAVTLTGIARGVANVTLEAKPAGGAWTTLSTVTPGASGAFTTTLTPGVTTQYRLTAGDVHAGLVRVAVVPLVEAQVGTGAVQGSVQPPLAGSPVQLQLQSGRAWQTIVAGTTDSAGSFALPAQLRPGSYRVRCAPGHGLSPGVSLALSVP